MSSSLPGRAALLIVDMQVGLFHGPQRPYRADAVIANVNALIRKARAAGVPRFFAQHTGPAGSPIERGAPAWQLLPELEVDHALDTVFEKTRPSCFAGTPLQDALREAAVDVLVVAGLKTQYCIDTTCRIASEYGYRVLLAADAHSTMDGEHLAAEAIVRHHNLTLAGAFATVPATDEIAF